MPKLRHYIDVPIEEKIDIKEIKEAIHQVKPGKADMIKVLPEVALQKLHLMKVDVVYRNEY